MNRPDGSEVHDRVVSLLAGVDRGAYGDALAYVDAEPERDDCLEDILIRAEVALYLDRFDDASHFVELFPDADLFIDDAGEHGALARRARLVRLETACFSGDLETAERLVRPLVALASRLKDRQAEMRGLYDLARISRLRGDLEIAIERLELAMKLA